MPPSPPPPGRRGTRGTRAPKSTAAEELAPVLGKIAEKKVIASEDYFAPLRRTNYSESLTADTTLGISMRIPQFICPWVFS